MAQVILREAIAQRIRLEARVTELGGVIPAKWPWDDTGELRNTQLIELIEELENQNGT